MTAYYIILESDWYQQRCFAVISYKVVVDVESGYTKEEPFR